VFVAVAVNLVGIRLVGDCGHMESVAGRACRLLPRWRCCLMRDGLRVDMDASAASGTPTHPAEAHQRLLRAEVGPVAAIVCCSKSACCCDNRSECADDDPWTLYTTDYLS